MQTRPKVDVAELVEAALAEYAKASAQPFRYRFSKGGEPCLRALVYDALEADEGKDSAEEYSLKGALASAFGKTFHEFMQAGAVKLGHGVELKVRFDTGAVEVLGSLDWKPSQQVVIDFKCVGENTWSKVARKPLPKHVLQVSSYAVAEDAPFAGILYFDGGAVFRKGPVEREAFRLYVFPAEVEQAQQLCAVWEDVDAHRKLKTLPERPWGASKDSWPCSFCRHREQCQPPERRTP